MQGKIWKTALLGWVMLVAAASSNPSQPDWKIAGSYASATDCVAAIGEKLATSSVVGGLASWASGALGAASGAGTSPTVAPFVCLPSNHPWVASVGGASPSGQGQETPPAAPPAQ